MLSSLPPEILIQILKQPVLCSSDLCSLSRVNHKLSTPAKEYLYRFNARFGQSSALSWAAERGEVGTAQLALTYGADINVRSFSQNGARPLFLAAKNNHVSLVRFLLRREGVDVNSRGNVYHETALSIASQHGNLEVVNVLLGHEDIQPDWADTSGQTPLFWACCNGHPAIAQGLAERKDVDINRQRMEDGATPLMAAIASGYTAVVEGLLSSFRKREINLNICKSNDAVTALMLAVIKQHTKIFELLLATFPGEIDLSAQDSQGMTVLSHAANVGAESIVQTLLDTKGSSNVNHQNVNGITPLAMASNRGFEDIVRLLLEHGADASLLDSRGWSPLHWAAQCGHSGVVRLLLDAEGTKAKVDPGLRSFVGTTALHCASWDGHYDVIKLLLNCDENVDINCKDNAGWTPLMWAASIKRPDLLCLLLADRRVDVNAQNDAGMTALHYAAKKGHKSAVEILISHQQQQGIDLTAVKDGDGKTARTYAVENGYGDVADMLSR